MKTLLSKTVFALCIVAAHTAQGFNLSGKSTKKAPLSKREESILKALNGDDGAAKVIFNHTPPTDSEKKQVEEAVLHAQIQANQKAWTLEEKIVLALSAGALIVGVYISWVCAPIFIETTQKTYENYKNNEILDGAWNAFAANLNTTSHSGISTPETFFSAFVGGLALTATGFHFGWDNYEKGPSKKHEQKMLAIQKVIDQALADAKKKPKS